MPVAERIAVFDNDGTLWAESADGEFDAIVTEWITTAKHSVTKRLYRDAASLRVRVTRFH